MKSFSASCGQVDIAQLGLLVDDYWRQPQIQKYIIIVLYCRQRRTEPRLQVTCTENFMKSGYVIFEIFERTDRNTDIQANKQTYRHVDRIVDCYSWLKCAILIVSLIPYRSSGFSISSSRTFRPGKTMTGIRPTSAKSAKIFNSIFQQSESASLWPSSPETLKYPSPLVRTIESLKPPWYICTFAVSAALYLCLMLVVRKLIVELVTCRDHDILRSIWRAAGELNAASLGR